MEVTSQKKNPPAAAAAAAAAPRKAARSARPEAGAGDIINNRSGGKRERCARLVSTGSRIE